MAKTSKAKFLEYAEEKLSNGPSLSAGDLKESALSENPKWVRWIPYTATLSAWLKTDKRFVVDTTCRNKYQWKLAADLDE